MALIDSFNVVHADVQRLWLQAERRPSAVVSQFPILVGRLNAQISQFDALAPNGLVFSGISASETCARLIGAYFTATTQEDHDNADLVLACGLLESCAAWLNKASRGITLHDVIMAAESRMRQRLAHLNGQLAEHLSDRHHLLFEDRLRKPSSEINRIIRELKVAFGLAIATDRSTQSKLGSRLTERSGIFQSSCFDFSFVFGLGNDLSEPPFAMIQVQDGRASTRMLEEQNESWSHASRLISQADWGSLIHSSILEELDGTVCDGSLDSHKPNLMRDFTAGAVPVSVLHPNWRAIDYLTANPSGRGHIQAGRNIRVAFWTSRSKSGSVEEADLESARHEISTLQRFADINRCEFKTVSGAECNRSAFLSEDWTETDVLHFASHGHANRGHPECAHLELCELNGSDSLHYYDILGADLDSVQLVVLNCCVTGAGTFFFGTDSLSLGYAFLAAGAKAVIATRWPLSSRVAVAFTQEFYGRLLPEGNVKGQPIHDAYFDTIEAMRNDPKLAKVIYWGAYALLY